MKIKLKKNKSFLQNLCKIIIKNNYAILLVNYDKLEFLNKYKNVNTLFNKTYKNKLYTFLIIKLFRYKNKYE